MSGPRPPGPAAHAQLPTLRQACRTADHSDASLKDLDTPRRTLSRRGEVMDLYVIRRRGAWANPQELEAAGARSAKVGSQEMPDRVRWIRSYVVREPDNRLGTVCIYEARDPESIGEHARRVGMPGDEILPVLDTVVVAGDPAKAKT